MKLQFFNTLNAVLKRGSLAGAAAEMNLTPSAVSMQMKQLEEYFGQALFDRSALQVRPTPFALELNASLQATLGTIDTMRRRASPAVEGKMRVGVVETMQVLLLPSAMRFLRTRYPLLETIPVRGRSTELIESLKAGKIDAAVVAQPETGGSSRFVWHPLRHEKLVMIAPPDAQESSVAALLESYGLIRFDKNTISGRLAARYLAARGFNGRIHMDLQSTHAVVAMVSAGLGISIVVLPDPRICMAYPVRIIPLGEDAPAMRFSLAARRADIDNRAIMALREAFASVPPLPKF